MKKSILAILILTASLVASADAPEVTPYVGYSMGASNLNSELCDLLDCDDNSIALKIFGGARMTPNFALEASINYYGSYKINQYEGDYRLVGGADIYGITGSVIGIIPVSKTFEVFGKAGLVGWKSDLDIDIRGFGSVSEEITGAGYVLGTGLMFNTSDVTSLRIEVEHTNFNADGEFTVTVGMLSILLYF